MLHYFYEADVAIASCRIFQAAVGAKPAAGEPRVCTDFAIALALHPSPTPVVIASPAYSNKFIPSVDQDNGFFHNALLNRPLLTDPYDEWSGFTGALRLLEALFFALLSEQPKLKSLELEYVSEFFWFDRAFLALSDVGHK